MLCDSPLAVEPANSKPSLCPHINVRRVSNDSPPLVSLNEQQSVTQPDAPEMEFAQAETRIDELDLYYNDELKRFYPDLDVPPDITPADFEAAPQAATSASTLDNFFTPFESSLPAETAPQLEISSVTSLVGETNANTTPTRVVRRAGRPRTKREVTKEDKSYRSDREYVKRRSHQKMIWFFRRLNIRHPAAIRTHLERVKHPDFEIPTLGCVLPHQRLSISSEDGAEAKTTTKNSEPTAAAANSSYYNLYCATPALVDRVRKMMGPSNTMDPNYNKKIIAFVADIVGRLLWHTNRTHAVMFAKSDHLDRDCFLLYSRQVEPTPFMMRSDSYFCRRHDSEKYRTIAPQPDLTRANSSRVSNESSIYMVGCELSELWSSFPYEYRETHCRPMRPLCERVKQLDSSVLACVFSPVNTHLNGDRDQSQCVEVAASTKFDVLSVMLRDPDSRDITADDHTSYRDYLERFITVATLNVHATLKVVYESRVLGGYGDTDARVPPTKRLKGIVLHHVRHRREVRSLRTNHISYFRNADDFICSYSLLDDTFEDRRLVDDGEVARRRPVYFYDIVHPSEYTGEWEDVNHLVMHCWEEASTMIRESSYTIGHRLTPEIVLKGLSPEDPFYPPSDMSPIDLAIDRMLERAIKHSKKIKLPDSSACTRNKGGNSTTEAVAGQTVEAEPPVDPDKDHLRNAISRSLSRVGENRLREGYTSPTRQNIETTITHNGEEIPIQIKVGTGERPPTLVDYSVEPDVRVIEKLPCAYLIDPTSPKQMQIISGSRIADSSRTDHVRLKESDRIVRVFCIQHVDGTYLIRPFEYIVFRNMPYAAMESETIDEIYRDMMEYDGNLGFGVFPRRPSDRCRPNRSPEELIVPEYHEPMETGDGKQVGRFEFVDLMHDLSSFDVS